MVNRVLPTPTKIWYKVAAEVLLTAERDLPKGGDLASLALKADTVAQHTGQPEDHDLAAWLWKEEKLRRSVAKNRQHSLPNPRSSVLNRQTFMNGVARLFCDGRPTVMSDDSGWANPGANLGRDEGDKILCSGTETRRSDGASGGSLPTDGKGCLGQLREQAGRNASERRAGLETSNVGADPTKGRGRPSLQTLQGATGVCDPTGVMAMACLHKETSSNTRNPSGGGA